MYMLLDRCRANTARLQDELRRQIQFIESGIRLNVPAGELEAVRAQLAEHESLVEQYAHLQ
jgi:hypothetical protein